MEKWMPICGYEGLYEISSEGRVASFHNGCRHILKPIMANAGYYVVTLYGAGSHRQFFIHRLVGWPSEGGVTIMGYGNDWTTFETNGYVEFTVGSDFIDELKNNGINIRGTNFTLTAISIAN